MARLILFTIITLAIFSCKKEDDDISPPIPTEISEMEMLQTAISTERNPNDITPLAAAVTFESFDSTSVEIKINGPVPISFQVDTLNTKHQIPIIGLYPDTTNQVFIKIIDQNAQFFQDTLTIVTPPLPDFMPQIEIVKASPAEMEPGFSLSELNIGGGGQLRTIPILFDHQGVIRWFINLEFTGSWTAPFKKFQNGNLFFGHAHTVYEYDWLGKEINRWEHWGFFQHHDLIEKPDGNFIVPVTQEGIGTGLDQIIELDRATGEVVNQWDLRAVLDINRFDLLWQSYDWLHVNSVFYDEQDGGLVISGRNQGIFKVSAENELQWIIGAHRGWGQAGVDEEGPLTSDFLFTAIDPTGSAYEDSVQEGDVDATDFSWAWGQHDAQVLPNGHILAFDNGWKRNFENAGQNGFSKIVEYEIDEEDQTITQFWEYGQQRGSATFSENISSVAVLPKTKNRLFCPGNIHQPELVGAKIIELQFPSKNVVFEANIRFKNSLSTGNGWGQADIVYRSQRVGIY